jgi:predicted O-methyltransferase YrrM
MRSKRETTFTEPSEHCPNPQYWHSADCETTELEVVELVAAFVRALQPELVVETGTYNGTMAREIGKALKKNGHGRLVTFEVDPVLHEAAKKRCKGLPVELKLQSSLDWEPDQKIDFCWFDSGLETRVQEFKQYYPHLKGSIIGIHDTAPQHQVRGYVEEAILGHLSPMWLNTPRGVMFAQVL